ncbi:uncharacterized protein LOC130821494 [Amaranthus tricolor]|uniref:uncharacterized protein LOC130821494 n=1 Tax=Amaranthus tricolor TaxID=29722 RepID=UPI002583F75F|nr:uncharacterized protein LOC130821494 [Amaranthus tricolor]
MVGLKQVLKMNNLWFSEEDEWRKWRVCLREYNSIRSKQIELSFSNFVGLNLQLIGLAPVVEVKRCSERIKLVRIVVGEEIISVISAYGPQVGNDEQVEQKFWDNLGDSVWNESGENLLEFALVKKLLITNVIFRKKDKHLITYNSGGHET